MKATKLRELATRQNFSEAGYLACNPDVKAAVAAGGFKSGFDHFRAWGEAEKRGQIALQDLSSMRSKKLQKLAGAFRTDLPSSIDSEGRHNFLTDELRAETRIIDTSNISSNGYDEDMLGLIEKYSDGIILDCGAGSRGEYYENVVNLEIAAYPSTDVLAVGEHLPFKDGVFDAVFSIAVLEHVRDPFRCANEIIRVLKPGGTLYCCVPFLQPLHGYPHQYFNASPQGHRRLFEDALEIKSLTVSGPVHPIFALTWIANSWANGLSTKTRENFLKMNVGALLANPISLLSAPFCAELNEEKRFELACGSILTAQKPLGQHGRAGPI